MKKVLILTSAFLLLASSCFAFTDVASTATGTMSLANSTGGELHAAATSNTADLSSALIGKTSTGVGIGWKTDVNGYAIVTQHKSGTKAYGTSYDSTSLYQYIKDKTPGNEVLAVPTATDTSDFTGSDWKAM